MTKGCGANNFDQPQRWKDIYDKKQRWLSDRYKIGCAYHNIEQS